MDEFKFQILEDPNKPDEHRRFEWNGNKMKMEKSLHKNWPIDKLKEKLKKDDYFECKINKTHWAHGEAIMLSDPGHNVIYLPTRKSCGRSFDGDIVIVKKLGHHTSNDSAKRMYGEVKGILERKEKNLYEKRFVCRVDDNNSSFMIPIDDNNIRFYVMSPSYHHFKSNKVFLYQRKEDSEDWISLKEKKSKNVVANNHGTHRIASKLFVVRYIQWSKNYWHPYGYVEDVIDPGRFIKYKIMCKIPKEHSEDVRKNAKKLIRQSKKPRKHSVTRLDLTELFVFTIDEGNSKILDDALSIDPCSEHKDCWKIGIHIADVASVVPVDSEVDLEAKKRSLSFKENCEIAGGEGQMLPLNLSMECSLVEGKERSAVSTFFHSTHSPSNVYNKSENRQTQEVLDSVPICSKIKSRRKLSYQEAQDLINQHISEESNCTNKMLAEKLYNFWKVMWSFRVRRLDTAAFYQSISNFDHDFITFRQSCIAHVMLEEAMITLNAFTAQLFKAKGASFLARTQLPPRPESTWTTSSLSLYQTSCRNYHNTNVGTSRVQEKEQKHVGNCMIVSTDVWNEISSALQEGRTLEAVLLACCDELQPELIAGLETFQYAQQKAMQKYYFSNKFEDNANLFSHFSLRVALYLQCSSPIRRYVDLVTQRSLFALLKEEEPDHYEWNNRDIADVEDVEDCVQRFQEITTQQKNLKHFVSGYFEGYVIAANEREITVKFPSLRNKFVGSLSTSELGPTKKTFIDNLEQNVLQYKLEWTLRYYDIALQQKLMEVKRTKQREQNVGKMQQFTVSTDEWKRFLDSLRKNCTLSGDLQSLADSLQRVVDSLSVKNGALFLSRYKEANITSNGIAHARKVELEINPLSPQISQTPLYFQFTVGLEQCIESLVPQLFYLNPNSGNSPNRQGHDHLEICLSHRRHVTMFDIDYVTPEDKQLLKEFEMTSKKLFLYYSKWISLVRMDGVYSSVHGNNSIVIQLEDVKDGQFSLGNHFCDVCFITVRKGDFVCIRKKTSTDKDKFNCWVGHGVITGVKKNDKKNTSLVRFKIFESIETGVMPKHDGPTTCEIIPLSVSHRRMADALFALTFANELQKNICIGNLISPSCSNKNNTTNMMQKIECLSIGDQVIENLQHKLNKKQVQQVKKALKNRVTLIQGPPGTGKSFMGAHLAYYFCKLNKQLGKEGKVLYCGPSNKSVDVVAGYLQKIPSLRVMRVCGGMLEELDFPIPIKPSYDSSDVIPMNSSLHPVTLHHVIRQKGKPFAAKLKIFDEKFRNNRSEVTFEDYDEYRKLLVEAKELELNETDVILCTCIVAGSKLLSKLRYSQCVIDESGMCSEPECLVPIVTATKRNDFDELDEDEQLQNPMQNLQDVQVTLIGDHKQLQPIVTCHAAGKAGLNTSMFERLKSKAEKLTVQYRMHETISKFPSEEFYDHELETDDSVKRRENGLLRFPLSNQNNTAVFCHVTGWEEDESKSKFNLSQVEVMIKILSYLLISNSVKPSNVMILSPYLAQCRKMKEAIKKHPKLKHFLDDLRIGSVVTSQGSEADYVILSTVRSSPENVPDFVVDSAWLYKYLGFVTDDHQINVAITRAKLGLCIIGNKNLLMTYSTWKHLIREYERRGSVMNLQETDVDEIWKIKKKNNKKKIGYKKNCHQ